MSCPTCGHTMHTVIEHTHWCPRCGTLKSTSCPAEVPSAVSLIRVGDDTYSALEVAMVLARYWYNVRRDIIAQKIIDHFNKNNEPCMDLHEIVDLLDKRGADIATALPFPTAMVYVSHAIEKYGREIKEEAAVNLKYYLTGTF